MNFVTISDAAKMLEACYANRDQVVPCLIGDPGIGKTESVYRFAEEIGVEVVEIILSQCLPTEISGITMPDQESKSMEIFDHSRMSRLKDGDILLLDELLEAPPMVLSACLTLIQERRMMSGRKLPDIMIVAATNPTVSPATLKLSMRQRFMWVGVTFDKDEWIEYVKSTLGIEISINDVLLDMIRTDSEEWNVLTPRSAWKIMKMLADSESKDWYEKTLARKFVETTFGRSTLDAITMAMRSTTAISKAKDVLRAAIASDFVDDEKAPRFKPEEADAIMNLIEDDDVDETKMMKVLTSLESWHEFEESLKKIEL